jgi:hypothetical protein
VADAQLKAVISAEDKASKVIADVGGSLDKVQSKLKSMQPAFKTMAAVGTVALGAIGGLAFKAVKDFSEAEASTKQLEHAVIDVTHATREQFKATLDLADALEKKGVLDGDNIKRGLAQLSTFGLSNDAVRNLGQSLADLAVNQYGVSASGDQLADSANMIAKALNGQFGILEKSGIRFTEAQKHIIEFGTETEKVTALNQGFQQNLKYTNDVALTTFEGKLAATKVQLGNVSENIGKALIPALQSLLEKVAPVIEKFVQWSQDHPELLVRILAVGAGIAGLTLAIGTFGLLLPGIITAVYLLGTALAFVAANPIVLLIAALVLMALKVKAAMDAVGGAKEFFKQTWDGIVIIFQEAWESIKRFALDPLESKINSVKNALASIAGHIPGFSLGKSLGSFLTGRASGGLVSPTRSFIVGENGPELFTPFTYGSISNRGGGGNIVVNVYGDVSGHELSDKVKRGIMQELKFNAQV